MFKNIIPYWPFWIKESNRYNIAFYQAVIKKDDVLAYFKYENEIVVDYRKLKQIEVFEK